MVTPTPPATPTNIVPIVTPPNTTSNTTKSDTELLECIKSHVESENIPKETIQKLLDVYDVKRIFTFDYDSATRDAWLKTQYDELMQIPDVAKLKSKCFDMKKNFFVTDLMRILYYRNEAISITGSVAVPTKPEGALYSDDLWIKVYNKYMQMIDSKEKGIEEIQKLAIGLESDSVADQVENTARIQKHPLVKTLIADLSIAKADKDHVSTIINDMYTNKLDKKPVIDIFEDDQLKTYLGYLVDRIHSVDEIGDEKVKLFIKTKYKNATDIQQVLDQMDLAGLELSNIEIVITKSMQANTAVEDVDNSSFQRYQKIYNLIGKSWVEIAKHLSLCITNESQFKSALKLQASNLKHVKTKVYTKLVVSPDTRTPHEFETKKIKKYRPDTTSQVDKRSNEDKRDLRIQRRQMRKNLPKSAPILWIRKSLGKFLSFDLKSKGNVVSIQKISPMKRVDFLKTYILHQDIINVLTHRDLFYLLWDGLTELPLKVNSKIPIKPLSLEKFQLRIYPDRRCIFSLIDVTYDSVEISKNYKADFNILMSKMFHRFFGLQIQPEKKSEEQTPMQTLRKWIDDVYLNKYHEFITKIKQVNNFLSQLQSSDIINVDVLHTKTVKLNRIRTYACKNNTAVTLETSDVKRKSTQQTNVKCLSNDSFIDKDDYAPVIKFFELPFKNNKESKFYFDIEQDYVIKWNCTLPEVSAHETLSEIDENNPVLHYILRDTAESVNIDNVPHYYLIMPYFARSNHLGFYLRLIQPKKKDLFVVLLEIVAAIYSLAQVGICFDSLSVENILLRPTQTRQTSSPWNLQIANKTFTMLEPRPFEIKVINFSKTYLKTGDACDPNTSESTCESTQLCGVVIPPIKTLFKDIFRFIGHKYDLSFFQKGSFDLGLDQLYAETSNDFQVHQPSFIVPTGTIIRSHELQDYNNGSERSVLLEMEDTQISEAVGKTALAKLLKQDPEKNLLHLKLTENASDQWKSHVSPVKSLWISSTQPYTLDMSDIQMDRMIVSHPIQCKNMNSRVLNYQRYVSDAIDFASCETKDLILETNEDINLENIIQIKGLSVLALDFEDNNHKLSDDQSKSSQLDVLILQHGSTNLNMIRVKVLILINITMEELYNDSVETLVLEQCRVNEVKATLLKVLKIQDPRDLNINNVVELLYTHQETPLHLITEGMPIEFYEYENARYVPLQSYYDLTYDMDAYQNVNNRWMQAHKTLNHLLCPLHNALASSAQTIFMTSPVQNRMSAFDDMRIK